MRLFLTLIIHFIVPRYVIVGTKMTNLESIKNMIELLVINKENAIALTCQSIYAVGDLPQIVGLMPLSISSMPIATILRCTPRVAHHVKLVQVVASRVFQGERRYD